MTKVLVIDDEKPTLSMFRLFLTAYGYEVLTARSGLEGLAIFNSERPEIVFTDIKMPGMDGLTVLRKIQSSGTSSQTIVITGHGDLEKALEALDLDASDFINKPVDRQALDAALNRAEKRRQLPVDMPFTVSRGLVSNEPVLTLSGRFTGPDLDLLSGHAARTGDGSRTVILDFDDSFSLDRSGLGALTKTIQQMHGRDIRIILNNVSCNYSRLFKMVGMDKLADIREARVEE